MSPEERAYRDAWLRELWPTVPEWHATKDERNDARERNDLLTPTQGIARLDGAA